MQYKAWWPKRLTPSWSSMTSSVCQIKKTIELRCEIRRNTWQHRFLLKFPRMPTISETGSQESQISYLCGTHLTHFSGKFMVASFIHWGNKTKRTTQDFGQVQVETLLVFELATETKNLWWLILVSPDYSWYTFIFGHPISSHKGLMPK